MSAYNIISLKVNEKFDFLGAKYLSK